MRDDFSGATKGLLAKRVGFCCSNPDCRQPTSGPTSDRSGGVNIGVASHITAAAPGGPRYDEEMSPEERASADNGIWLCENCAKLVDSDASGHSVNLLKEWKQTAEAAAYLELRGYKIVPDDAAVWEKIEKSMPDLIA